MTDGFSLHKVRPGWIEVIAGCMYSGKTEELILQLRRAELARQRFQVFKPRIDDRYAKNHVASHNQNKFPSEVVDTSQDILKKVEKYSSVIGIDEGQFFDAGLIDIANQLAESGKRVIIAGLDTDWKGRPFGPMPALMAIAEVVRKQYAICMICGEPATRSQRLIAEQQDILVGSTQVYEARCRNHFDPELSLRLERLKTIKPSAPAIERQPSPS